MRKARTTGAVDERLSLFLVIVVTSVVGVSALVVSTSDRVQMRRRFGKFKPKRLAQLPENSRAKIVGTVAYTPQTLRSPLTDRQCVCYQIIAEGVTGRVLNEFFAVPFFVDDGTGRALVDPAGGEVRVHKTYDRQVPRYMQASDGEQRFVRRYVAEGGPMMASGFRYREGVIQAGDWVEVIGAGVHEPDPEAVRVERGYRDLPTMRLRLIHTVNNRLLVRHAPKGAPIPGDPAA
jgi:hypothetical protein